MGNNELELSPLAHTWLLDLDGTVLKHNGYKIDGKDTLLSGAKEFIESIPPEDIIIFLTSRKNNFKTQTINFLKRNGIRYSKVIFEVPYGERVLINDTKPSGLNTGIVFNKKRDSECFPKISINHNL